MNYIEIYYGKIKSGDAIVSEKVKKLFEHLHDKLHDSGSRYIFDEKKANHAIDFMSVIVSTRKANGQVSRLFWKCGRKQYFQHCSALSTKIRDYGSIGSLF